MSPWEWLPRGYLLTVLIETPVLLAGLSPVHSLRRRLFAALWLTACTYPIVALALPALLGGTYYLLVAETFAPACECLLFRALFPEGRLWRDCAAIVAANLASFGIGWWLLW